MSKEYFSHDYHTRNKKKLAAIVHDYRMEGYGLFWVIVEMLHEDSEHWMELDHITYVSIAKESGCTNDFVEDFIKKCISDYKVFIEENGRFTTERVLINIDKRLDIKEKRSKAGKCSAESRNGLTGVEHVFNSDLTKSNKGKERKGKENSKVAKATVAFATDVNLKSEFEKLEIPDTPKDAWGVVKAWITDKNPEFIEPYIAAWNIFASVYKFPQAVKISDQRRKKFNTRIRDGGFDFFAILDKAKQSEFIKSGNFFTFDWVFENDSNYLKVIEGNYK